MVAMAGSNRVLASGTIIVADGESASFTYENHICTFNFLIDDGGPRAEQIEDGFLNLYNVHRSPETFGGYVIEQEVGPPIRVRFQASGTTEERGYYVFHYNIT